MSVSRKRPSRQPDSVPQARPSHGTGDGLQPEAPTTTPPGGGTTGGPRPVPYTFTLVVEHLDRATLDALLTVVESDNDPESPGCPTCGRPPFDTRLSGLLDLATLAHEATGGLKAALEQAVRP